MARVVVVVAIACCASGCGRFDFVNGPGDGPRPADARPDARSLDAPMPLLGEIGHWTFDEGQGVTAADVLGISPALTLVNGPVWTTGIAGGGVTADGIDDYLVAPTLALGSTQAVTVALWVNRAYAMTMPQTLFELSPDYNQVTSGLGLYPEDMSGCPGDILVSVHGDVGYAGNCFAFPSSGVWHHVVAVFDKSQLGPMETALYIDGVAQSPNSGSAVDNTNDFAAQPFYLFARGGVEEFTAGTIDELRIFSRALTPGEIASLSP